MWWRGIEAVLYLAYLVLDVALLALPAAVERLWRAWRG